MDSNTTIYLISNGSYSFFPQNSLTNFKNKIPHAFNVNNEYEIAVESIGFTKSFKQIHIPDDDIPSFFISKSDLISYVTTPANEKVELIEKRMKTLQDELDNIAIYTNDHIHIENEDENKFLRLRRRDTVNYDDFADLKTFPFYFKDNETYTKNKLKEYFNKVSIISGIRAFYDDSEDKAIFSMKNNAASNNESYFVVMHETFLSSFLVNNSTFLTMPTELFSWEQMPDNGSVFSINRENKEVTIEIKVDLIEIFYKNEKYYAAHIQSNKHNIVCENVAEVMFPTLVKLKCGNITSQIMNSSYSQDLVVFCPDFSKKDKFFYHEFDSLQYVPLSNTILKDIEISLCDEKDRLLQLSSGIPTILKLSLKKMDTKKESFNLRLTSAQNEEHKNNMSSSFKVTLPVTLNLDRKWKVALTSISHPNEFNTFLKDEDSRSLLVSWKNSDNDITPIRHKLTLKEYYSNTSTIVNEINNFFEEKQIGSAKIKDETLSFYFERNCVLVIGNYLLRILGFTAIDDISNYRNFTIFPIRFNSSKSYIQSNQSSIIFTFQDPISLNLLDAKYICMYADFISPVILAGEYHKLLRIIPIRDSKTGFVITEFRHKAYYELQNTEIKEISIELRAHDGELINFKSKQNIILNLLFTNYID